MTSRRCPNGTWVALEVDLGPSPVRPNVATIDGSAPGGEVDGDTRLRLRVLGELDGHPGRCRGRPRRAAPARRAGGPGRHARPGRVRRAPRRRACGASAAPANTAGAIQAYVSHLRRRLQPEAGARSRDGVIARIGAGYVLRLGPDTVDAWRFEQARRRRPRTWPPADASRRSTTRSACGAAPPTPSTPASRGSRPRSPGSTELRDVARERLLDARLQLGDAALLVGDLEALVADDPLREERWRLLVLALYRAQRQADALAALRRARRRWPTSSASTRDPPCARWRPRCSRSHRRWTPRHPPAVVAPAAGDAGIAARVRPPTWSTATGRRRCCARAVDDLASGTSGCVLIEGPAGIGKTRLLLEARPAGDGGRHPGAVGAGQRAGAVLRLRRRAPAVRAVHPRPGSPRGAARRRGRRCAGGVRGRRRRPGARRQLRRPARALLADRQPGRRGPAADLRRRRPVVRQRVAALPRLPGQAARGAAGPAAGHGADRRGAPRRRAARRDRPRPSRSPCSARSRSLPRPPACSCASG